MIDKNTFITADNHFGHNNVFYKYEPIRLEASTRDGYGNDCNQHMIDKWNEEVSDKDTIFNLGDLYFESRQSTFEIEKLNKLNGTKFMIVGNHDRPKYYNKLDNRWTIIEKIKVDGYDERQHKDLTNEVNSKYRLTQKEKRLQVCYIKEIDGKKIMFSHFPLFNNNEFDSKYQNIVDSLEYLYKKFKCELNIHGHTHSNGSVFKDSFSACLELNDFKPIKLEAIISQQNNGDID